MLSRLLGSPLLAQATRYVISGGTAVAVLFLVLVLLVEFTPLSDVAASAIGFACGTAVNYTLQHRFVFNAERRHGLYLSRYLMVTAATMGLNSALFWFLDDVLGIFYAVSQALTLIVIVPLNFMINRSFTFAEMRPAAGGRCR